MVKKSYIFIGVKVAYVPISAVKTEEGNGESGTIFMFAIASFFGKRNFLSYFTLIVCISQVF